MIDWINTLLVSLSMSIDAMMVSATNGLKKNMPSWKILLQQSMRYTSALFILSYLLEILSLFFFHYRHYNIRSFFLSVLLAKQIAKYLEKWAGLIAAIVFLAVGLKILLEGIL